MLSLVRQSKAVTLRDVGAAIKHLEPVCAALCAERDDRHTAVIPRLQAVHQEALDCPTDDQLQLTALTRQFHEELVNLCGNQTMIQLIGALETLWSSHQQQWAERVSEVGEFPAPTVRKNSLKTHEKMIGLIEAGRADEVARLARTHLDGSVFYASGDGSMTISASSVR
jgi:DNA-binding FadR family transcriptional regulator